MDIQLKSAIFWLNWLSSCISSIWRWPFQSLLVPQAFIYIWVIYLLNHDIISNTLRDLENIVWNVNLYSYTCNSLREFTYQSYSRVRSIHYLYIREEKCPFVCVNVELLGTCVCLLSVIFFIHLEKIFILHLICFNYLEIFFICSKGINSFWSENHNLIYLLFHIDNHHCYKWPVHSKISLNKWA